MNLPNETRIRALQGGGALGACKAGAYEAFAASSPIPTDETASPRNTA